MAVDASKSELLVALMGMTGSGKSTFLRDLVLDQALPENSSLRSGTDKVSHYTINIGGRSVHLLDTPGFDGTGRTDEDCVELLKNHIRSHSILDGWKQTLAGFLYFHRINCPRFAGSSVGAVDTLKRLLGDAADLRSIGIVTSFWDEVSPDIGLERQQELRQSPTFLKTLLDAGAFLERVPTAKSDKVALVGRLLGLKPSANATTPDANDTGKLGVQLRAISLDVEVAVAMNSSTPSDPTFESKLLEIAKRETALQGREVKLQQAQQAMETSAKQTEHFWQQSLQRQAEAYTAALTEQARRCSQLHDQVQTLVNQLCAQQRLTETKATELSVMKLSKTALLAYGQYAILLRVLQKRSVGISWMYPFCDACFQPIEHGGLYHSCGTCSSNEAELIFQSSGGYALCKPCRNTGTGCPASCISMPMRRWNSSTPHCRRLKEVVPFLVCDICQRSIRGAYLHCCQCLNDNYDICMPCAAERASQTRAPEMAKLCRAQCGHAVTFGILPFGTIDQ